MEDYTPNSHRYKEQQKNLPTPTDIKRVEKPVVTGEVKIKKKNPELNKIKNAFVSEDAHNIKSFLIDDILIPTIKKMISESVDMILYGRRGTSNSRVTVTDRFSYNQCSSQRNDTRVDSRRNSIWDYDDIILSTRGDAEAVLSQLDAIIDQYGAAKVSDMYDLVGRTFEYTDDRYGWDSLRSARIVRVRDGYLLDMPKATVLDR